jgi:branched-chain amino acid transport system substrate-binding protein
MTFLGGSKRGEAFVKKGLVGLCVAALWAFRAYGEPILVGLNADLTTADAESGEAIRRGALVAMEEINAAGGVLGRRLELEARDHRRNPARGKRKVRELAADGRVVAILGGKHTPVVVAELPLVHELGVPYLIPWAAGTAIVENGYEPNYVFRVSVNDALAGGYLVEHAMGRHGTGKVGLLLEQTAWGRSNEDSLRAALAARGAEPVHVDWFNWGQGDLRPALERFSAAGAEGIVFVGNAPDGVTLVRGMLKFPAEARVPVVSHWGVAGGDFVEPLGDALDAVSLCFLQTYSFFDPPFPERAERFLETWRRLYPEDAPIERIAAPAGVAHAYDLVHLLAKAIEQAGSADRAKVRDSLERIERHEGLVRDYEPPFAPGRHDALDAGEYRMARFRKGVAMPEERIGCESAGTPP